MLAEALDFDRPRELEAGVPPEVRGRGRDDVRLMVSAGGSVEHRRFTELPQLLHEHDLLVVNRSAAVNASLPARAAFGDFLLNLSTAYGRGLWLTEPRFATGRPGPVPLAVGEPFRAGGLRARVVVDYPGLPRLWFVALEGDVPRAMREFGRPITYGYASGGLGLSAYRSIFSDRPGSAEMPSAARPFTPGLLHRLRSRGVRLASITLHTGVSSLEVAGAEVERFPVYPEPFEVPERTVRAVAAARAHGGRVVAVGTTVVRALESAGDGRELRAARGFTRAFVRPGRGPRHVDALLTGFHDPRSSHLAMLFAFGGERAVRAAYREAVRARYLWHEFGDSHLIVRG